MKLNKVLFFLSLQMISPMVVAEDEKAPLWVDPKKKNYALVKKKYPKKGKIYMQAGYISNISSAFQDTSGLQLKGTYYFHENFGVEMYQNNYNNSKNANYDNVKEVNGSVPFVRRIHQSEGVMFIHAPFYGKVNTFNTIHYIDFEYGVGLGKMEADSNKKTVVKPTLKDRYFAEKYDTVNAKVGMKLHFRKNMYFSADFLNTNYQASSPGDGSKSWKQNNDFILGVGFGF